MKIPLFSLSGSFMLAAIFTCSVQTEGPCPVENSGVCISEFELWYKDTGKSQAIVELYFQAGLEVSDYILHFETLERDQLDLHMNYQTDKQYVVFNSTNTFFVTNSQQPIAIIITSWLDTDKVWDGIVCGYEYTSGMRRLGHRFSVESVIVDDMSFSFSRCDGDFVQTTPTWWTENSCSGHEVPVQEEEEDDAQADDEKDSNPSPSIHMDSTTPVHAQTTSGKITNLSPKLTTRKTTLKVKTTAKRRTTKTTPTTAAKSTTSKHFTKPTLPITTQETKHQPSTTQSSSVKTTHTISTKPSTLTTTTRTTSQTFSTTTNVSPTAKTSTATSVKQTTKTTNKTLKPQTSPSTPKQPTTHPTHSQTTSQSVGPTEHTSKSTNSSQHTQTPASVPPLPTSTGQTATSTRSGMTSSESSSSQSGSSSSRSGSSTSTESWSSSPGSTSNVTGTVTMTTESGSSSSGSTSNVTGTVTMTTESGSSSLGSTSNVTGTVTMTTESGSSSSGSTSNVTGTVTMTTESGSSSSGSQTTSQTFYTSSRYPTSTASPPVLDIFINEVNILLENGRNNTFIELQGPHHMTLVNYSIVVFDGQSKATLFHRRFVESDTFTGSGFFVVHDYKSSGHSKSVVVALFDNTKWMQYYQHNVPASEPQGLKDSFAVRTTNDKMDSELLENMAPTHSNRIVAIHPSMLANRPPVSMSRCQHNVSTDVMILDPGSFLLSHPTIGQLNNCTLGIGHRVQFKLTNANCHDFNNSKLQDELVDNIVEGVNKLCWCGMTQALVTERKYLCGSLIFEAFLGATMSWQSDKIFSNYRTFVKQSTSIVVGARSYRTDSTCYRDCLPPPINPNSGGGDDVTLTVAVVMACFGVFLIVVIGVIIYIRRKKKGIVTFRLTHLGEMDTSTMLHEDRDDHFGEDDTSTFKSMSLVTT